MRITHTDCYGCRYSDTRWAYCRKDGECTGVIPYPTIVSTSSIADYTFAETSELPVELEINGVKYRKVE